MVSDVLFSSKNTAWCTPQSFFDELDQEYQFNLDPAATAKSAKCAEYFTPEQDGLKMDWGGHRVFCNPPYGRAIKDWVKKGYEESLKPDTLVVMLIPARTDTAYFHDYIFGRASYIRFLRGRLVFTDEDGNPATDKQGRPQSAPFPSVIVVWGDRASRKSVVSQS
ncbi:MAG: phage N-6-adenine-methyltransferase [Oscillospiraceae bacterium]|nr:phage N-6-adenine-methyltransferase [Oscillospiraceae bacterium]